MHEPRTDRYDADFYADQVEESAKSASVILPLVFAHWRPTSLIDIGCGQGAWLAAAEALGVAELVGLDGDWVDRSSLRSARMAFRPTDLSGRITLDRRFDLALSVEVAEHLPREAAERFVQALCDAADVVLFGAAVPQQGGTEHVNEERASRWGARFAARDYDTFDLIRPAVWDDARVSWWYRQNCLLYVKRGTPAHAVFAAAPLPPMPRDLVHPEAFERKVAWYVQERARLQHWLAHPTPGQALRAVWRALTKGSWSQ